MLKISYSDSCRDAKEIELANNIRNTLKGKLVQSCVVESCPSMMKYSLSQTAVLVFLLQEVIDAHGSS